MFSNRSSDSIHRSPGSRPLGNSGISRRSLLSRSSVGFGSVALASLMQSTVEGGSSGLHHAAKAKRVIFLYMSGGVSHVDSFDPKPKLKQLNGKSMPVEVERTQFNNNGNVMASPFQFRPRGESGIAVSDMFPEIGGVADELAVIRSMTSPVNEHAQANFFMHSGFPFMGHPSAGAWCAYGLGTENENLPGFVVLQSGNAVPPHGGVSLFSSGFLPAQCQASILQAYRPEAIRNIQPQVPRALQRRRLELAELFDAKFQRTTGDDTEVEAAIRNYETAFRMQSAVPDLCDISQETAATRELYGVDSA